MAGYKSKYLKTYLWSGLSMVLNFVSMFIVAPLTTSMPEAYGVYSLCISFNIFIRYADLGFIAAGRKYAAEAYSNNDLQGEKRYVGTSIIIYGAMAIVFSLLTILASIYPELVIKDIEKGQYYGLSHQLLLILAFSFLFSTIHQFCSLIYSVRIEDYKIQRLQIFVSLIKIASVPVYFFNNRYDIVGYYLFCESINLLFYLFILFNSKKIGYGLRGFLKCLKFDKKVFHEILPLALSGFASVLGWIAYYELDTVGISILLGANAVAIYAVGKQIQTFVRSMVSIVYSPYPVRINYFIGQRDFLGLSKFFYKLVEVFSIIIIPIITVVLFARPFIISWVGQEYEQSIIIMQLLVSTFLLHFITSQGNSVIYGLNKVKDILKISVIQPFMFWIGVLLTYNILGIQSFAIFKLITALVTELYYCYLTRKYLGYRKKDFYWNLLSKPIIIISISCTTFWLVLSPLVNNVSKGHADLLNVVGIMALCCILTLMVYYCFNKTLRIEVRNMLMTIMK